MNFVFICTPSQKQLRHFAAEVSEIALPVSIFVIRNASAEDGGSRLGRADGEQPRTVATVLSALQSRPDKQPLLGKKCEKMGSDLNI
jgi:hypothetical protein